MSSTGAPSNDSTKTGMVQLFGGAISVALPGDFTDMSLIRDVPDNQEVRKKSHALCYGCGDGAA